MIEYKIREVTRYIVTRFEDNGNTGGSSFHGEYDNGELAYTVAYALAKAEADRLGYGPGDDRIQFPKAPKGVTGEGARF